MNLKQLISTPTRITPYTQTLLDVIMVSSNCSVSKSGVIHRPISDHSIVFAKLKIKKQKTVPQYVTTRSYKHYNGKQFACDLAKEEDALLTTIDKLDVDSKLKNLMDNLQHTLDSHAPQKQIKIRGRPCPFVNKEIKDMMKFLEIFFSKSSYKHATTQIGVISSSLVTGSGKCYVMPKTITRSMMSKLTKTALERCGR